MDSSWFTFILGLHDWLNPCFLGSMGVLAGVILLLRRKKAEPMLFAAGFILAYLAGSALLDLGFLNSLFLPSLKSYQMTITFYMTMAVIFLIFGGYLCYCWIKFSKGLNRLMAYNLPSNFVGFFWLAGLVIGGGMSFFAAFWPSSVEVAIVQTQAALPGRLLFSTVQLSLYELLRLLVPLILLGAYFWKRTDSRTFALIEKKRTFLCMLASTFYLGLGVSLIILFYPVRPV
ncbi:MAG: hypothetical protein HQL18_01785 [Candidatus Omnitrophica bacterium]|nr:hypothetical protein [Candidatus Omnitrophota bacterium]